MEIWPRTQILWKLVGHKTFPRKHLPPGQTPSPVATFHELWDDAALYFKHNDADSLAEAIRLLSENHSLRTEYAQRACERARRLFIAQRMVSDYEDLYFNLTSKRAAA